MTFRGPLRLDSTTNAHAATYEGGVAFYLPGASSAGHLRRQDDQPRVHFAGGALKAPLDFASDRYSVELWFWNGLPTDARPISGIILTHSSHDSGATPGDQLGIGGTKIAPGRLFFSNGKTSGKTLAGKTEIRPRTWHHLVLVREHDHVAVYLDGTPTPEIAGQVEIDETGRSALLWIGGHRGSLVGFEGKIDEVSLYDRALTCRRNRRTRSRSQ